VDGQGDGRNSTLLNPPGRLASGRGSNLSPLQVWARAPGRKELGDRGDWAKGERAVLSETGELGSRPPLCSGNGRWAKTGAWAKAPGVIGRLRATNTSGANKGWGDPGRNVPNDSRRQGPRGRDKKGGEMGEGDPTLLARASAFLPGRGRAPQRSGKRGDTPAGAGRVYAPWANSGASRAALPDYMSSCQSAAFSRPSSLAADYDESERRAFKTIFLRVAITHNVTLTCVNTVLGHVKNEPPKNSALPRSFRRLPFMTD
jgi:hypothetical protein